MWLDRVAASHGGASQLLEKLDTALLSKAFEGQLIPQNAGDEPASALLERVKAEFVAQPRKIQSRKQIYEGQTREKLMAIERTRAGFNRGEELASCARRISALWNRRRVYRRD